MADTKALEDYIEARDDVRAGKRRKAADGLAALFGVDEPTYQMEAAAGKLLDHTTPAGKAMLAQVKARMRKRRE